MKTARWIVALVAAVALSACGGGGEDSAPGEIDPNGELVLGLGAVPGGLDPHLEASMGQRPYWFLVYDRMTRLDSSGKLLPMLATEWNVADGGRSVTFKLRDDVKFHDGTPFDAEAVKANFERAKSLEAAKSAVDLATVESVVVKNPTEVTYKLSTPNVELPEILAGPAGAMISPAAIKEGRDFLQDPGDSGSGPYLVDTFTPNEKVTYTSAGKNWDPEAGKIKKLELRLVSAADQQSTFAAVRSGDLQAAFVASEKMTAVTQAEKLADSDDLKVVQNKTNVAGALLLRGTRIKDLRIRQAIMQGIDRKAITEDLMRNTCEYTDQFAREGFPGYIDDYRTPFPYDPDSAKKLLAEAGAEDMKLNIHFSAGYETIPQALQEQLAKVDLATELTPLAAIEMLTAWREDQVDAWYFQITPQSSPGLSGSYLAGPSIFNAEIPGLSDAVAKAQGTVDLDAREGAYEQMYTTALDDVIAVPICHYDSRYLVSKDVLNFQSASLPYAQYMVDLRYVARSK